MLKGAHWTTGALYATQTGLPTFFFENYFYKHKKVNNSIFSDDDNIYANKAVSWAKVLKKAGYDNWFMSNSNLNFSGTGKIMEALGYKTIEVQVKNDNRKSEWGPYDKNLFDKAKEKYVELNNGSKPFNLTLLTIDMHFPNGVQDNYLIPYIDKSIKFDSHEFSVASADYLLYNFIDFIKKNDKNNNTAIVVMGDHCMMGNKKITPIVGKLKNKKHRILFMTNKKINEYQPNDKIYFYDIPKIMLEVAGVNTNAKFPKDIIKNISPSYILKNQELFTVLNEKLYNRKDKSS